MARRKKKKAMEGATSEVAQADEAMEGPTSEVAQADEAEGDILPFQFRPSTDTWLEGRLPQPQPVPLEASVSSSEVEGHDYKLMPSVGTWLHLPRQEQFSSSPGGASASGLVPTTSQLEGGPEATSRAEVSPAEASVVSGEVDEQDYKLMPSVGTWLHLPQQEQVCSFPVGASASSLLPTTSQPEGGPEATSRPEVSFAEASVVSGEVDEQDYKLMPSAGPAGVTTPFFLRPSVGTWKLPLLRELSQGPAAKELDLRAPEESSSVSPPSFEAATAAFANGSGEAPADPELDTPVLQVAEAAPVLLLEEVLSGTHKPAAQSAPEVRLLDASSKKGSSFQYDDSRPELREVQERPRKAVIQFEEVPLADPMPAGIMQLEEVPLDDQTQTSVSAVSSAAAAAAAAASVPPLKLASMSQSPARLSSDLPLPPQSPSQGKLTPTSGGGRSIAVGLTPVPSFETGSGNINARGRLTSIADSEDIGRPLSGDSRVPLLGNSPAFQPAFPRPATVVLNPHNSNRSAAAFSRPMMLPSERRRVGPHRLRGRDAWNIFELRINDAMLRYKLEFEQGINEAEVSWLLEELYGEVEADDESWVFKLAARGNPRLVSMAELHYALRARHAYSQNLPQSTIRILATASVGPKGAVDRDLLQRLLEELNGGYTVSAAEVNSVLEEAESLSDSQAGRGRSALLRAVAAWYLNVVRSDSPWGTQVKACFGRWIPENDFHLEVFGRLRQLFRGAKTNSGVRQSAMSKLWQASLLVAALLLPVVFFGCLVYLGSEHGDDRCPKDLDGLVTWFGVLGLAWLVVDFVNGTGAANEHQPALRSFSISLGLRVVLLLMPWIGAAWAFHVSAQDREICGPVLLDASAWVWTVIVVLELLLGFTCLWLLACFTEHEMSLRQLPWLNSSEVPASPSASRRSRGRSSPAGSSLIAGQV